MVRRRQLCAAAASRAATRDSLKQKLRRPSTPDPFDRLLVSLWRLNGTSRWCPRPSYSPLSLTQNPLVVKTTACITLIRRRGGTASARPEDLDVFMRYPPGKNLVAQVCNLPYRRFAIGRAVRPSRDFAVVNIPQVKNLRYSRLQICATFYPCLTIICPGSARLIPSASNRSFTSRFNCCIPAW